MTNVANMRRSPIRLSLLHRRGYKSAIATAANRWTFDFIIDGQSLATLFDIAGRDLVGRLDRDDRAANAVAVRVLTGAAPPDLPPARVMLFVCPECGDLGCGAITAALRVGGDTVTWPEFLHENSYDESMTTPFPGVGPFTFDANTYQHVLRETARGFG